MNYLIIVVVLGISLFLANPLLLQPENVYEKDTYGQGYNIVEIKDSKEATEEEEEAMEEAEDDDDDY
jgi:hypothetical protein